MTNETHYESAIRKITWGRSNKDWPTDLSPSECAALLDVLTIEEVTLDLDEMAEGVR